MARCPSCSQPINNADLGLVTCDNCGASVMVDFDGSISNQEPSKEADPNTTAINSGGESETSVLQMPIEEDLDSKEMAEWGEEENSKVVTIGQRTMDYEEYTGTGEGVAPEAIPQGSVPEAPDFIDEPTQVIQHPYDGDYESVNETSSPEELSVGDIERYGNSNSSNDGPLLYSITISGIDSKELREQVKEALMDRRLLFDVDGLMKEIRDGQIELREVSSLKTHVLVNQLLSLPLKFEWGQEANGNP